MAGKDEGFSLSKRQETRYIRFDKQQEEALQKHLAVVKQIEKEWEIFKEQNSKALKLYRTLQEARNKDRNYQFDINESATWELVSDRIQEKGNNLAEESLKYKKEHKLIEKDKSEFYESCVKEWKDRQQSKGLYDTDLDEEVVKSGKEEKVHSKVNHLTVREKSRLEEESKYLTEQIIALGALHTDYIRERGRYPKGSYDYSVLEREKSKVDKYRKVYEHKLRDRTRILQGERATFELKSETEESDGGYSDIEGFKEERHFIISKVRKRKQRQPKPKLENFRPEEVERREKEREEQYRQQQRELQIRVFSESEFEDEEVLALSDRGMKISKALTNRVDAFLSDEDQVIHFIEDLEEEEYLTAEENEDSDVDFFDVGDALDNDNEDSLSTYGRSVVSQIQAENDDEFLKEVCHLIAMTQPEEDGQSILADILKNGPKMTCGEECAHNSMEDICEPVVTQDLLRSLSMMQCNEATNPGENIHATQSQVVCDSSRFTANLVKMSEALKSSQKVAEVKTLQKDQGDQLAESLDVPSHCSADSACVGSSSGDLVLDKMENIKSELILDIPKEVVLDVTEENDQDGIWSKLTDNLHYLEVKSSFDSNPIKFQVPEQNTVVQSAKKKLFNAANNNIPLEEFQKEQQWLKLDRKSKQNNFERDQQYEGINATIDENFDPTKNITTTYLWTNKSGRLLEPKITTTEASWFPEGSFQIST